MKRSPKLKIFNDPIYGFIRIPSRLLFDLIDHPHFQRLRRISQMGMSYLVYPGAHHTRFHHALGAMYLMQEAIALLRRKGISIDDDEEQGLLCAILLHDIGHGPFSHALEKELVPGNTHEGISLRFMEALDVQFDGQLKTALSIFKGIHPRPFLNELVSSQLDMDRLDYLKRDSFYTGVAEGNINSERLISMLTVKDGHLAIEEKGIYSVEKFLMARRFMYWQVYLHKTGLAAEQLLVRIIRRARQVDAGRFLGPCGNYLNKFLILKNSEYAFTHADLEHFALIDDVDVLSALKAWQKADDPVLSGLCGMILDRKLPTIKISSEPILEDRLHKHRQRVAETHGISREDSACFVFDGQISNKVYDNQFQSINILKTNGKIRELGRVMDPLNPGAISRSEVKYYICYPKKGVT